MLAIDFRSPLFWAVLILWMMSVVLHEFAHGLVAYLGGDYTIKERGGLTLNPLQYIDPVFSILMPAIFLLLGGIPLPGGATYIRRDLLRSRLWSSAVSLAGPAMNLLLFFACLLPFHPRIGWLHPHSFGHSTNIELVLGALAVLQILSVLFNLVPVPPLDGFGAISPLLPEQTRLKLATPPLSTILFVAFFIIIWKTPALVYAWRSVVVPLLHSLGFGDQQVYFFEKAFDQVLFSESGS
jgi:Zn-dependent protease